MGLPKKVLFLTLAFLCFGRGSAEEPAGVLAPENANEARLNRLQPPGKVLDIIGVRPGMTVAELLQPVLPQPRALPHQAPDPAALQSGT